MRELRRLYEKTVKFKRQIGSLLQPSLLGFLSVQFRALANHFYSIAHKVRNSNVDFD
jgi:hypothetical protein